MANDSRTLALQNNVSPVEFAQKMAMGYAAIVGCNADQGMGVALAGYCDGLDPLQFKRRYHWIPGKGPSMQAAAMLAEFRMNHGGDYEVKQSTHLAAEVKFIDSKNREYNYLLTRLDLMFSRNPWSKTPGWKQMVTEVSTLVEQGVAEADIYAKVRHAFGDNYGTPFDWSNMLFARLVSQSLRKICPELAFGIYTPEEMEDVVTVEAVVSKPKFDGESRIAELLGEAKKSEEQQRYSSGNLPKNGADMPPVSTPPWQEPPLDPAPLKLASPSGFVSRILESAKVLWPDQSERDRALETICQKRGCSAVSMLSEEQAEEVASKLRALSWKQEQAALEQTGKQMEVSNPLLSAAVADYGTNAVWKGCHDLFKFPPALVSTAPEVEKLVEHLKGELK